MIFVQQGYVTIILVTLTLMLQSVGMAVLIQWIKAQFPNGIHQLGVFRSICARGAIHRSACLLAHLGDSVVGFLLSLEMFCNLGGGFLFFGGELCHCRIGGSSSQTIVANDGPGRKRYRCADVRALRQLPVCHCDPAHSPRGSGTRQPRRRLRKPESQRIENRSRQCEKPAISSTLQAGLS